MWQNLKLRLSTQWNFPRLLYVFMGSYVLLESGNEGHWLGVIFGAYFAAMGLFGFGCAGGNCQFVPPRNEKSHIQDVTFEEVKEERV